MDRTGKRLLMVALLLSLLVGFGVHNFLQGVEDDALDASTEEVVLVVGNIPARTTLTESMLRVALVPVGSKHAEASSNSADFIGMVTTSKLVDGEQLLSSRTSAGDVSNGISFELPEGYRALSIVLNEVIGVSFLIRVSDFVDVLVSYDTVDEVPDHRTDIVLQNIKVLAVGGEYKTGSASSVESETITLLVRPEQAERLVWAEDYGTIRLMLRPATDRGLAITEGVNADSVIGRR